MGIVSDLDDDDEADDTVTVAVTITEPFTELTIGEVQVRNDPTTPLPITMNKHLPELTDLTPEETQRLQVFYTRTDVDTVILKNNLHLPKIGTSLMFFQP